MEKRIQGQKSPIDYSATSRFFAGRAAKYSAETPYVATSYQDRAPDLAQARDHHEKGLILPLLNVNAESRVIDVGCGVGRWADSLIPLAAAYLGLDFCPELVEVARKRFAGPQHACDRAFETLAFQDLDAFRATPPFTHALVSGVMAYINDDALPRALRALAERLDRQSRVYLREPVGLEGRLTLDRFFSADLEAEYSAIYRPAGEYRQLLQEIFAPRGYALVSEGPMLTEQLANRRETGQHYFILER